MKSALLGSFYRSSPSDSFKFFQCIYALLFNECSASFLFLFYFSSKNKIHELKSVTNDAFVNSKIVFRNSPSKMEGKVDCREESTCSIRVMWNEDTVNL